MNHKSYAVKVTLLLLCLFQGHTFLFSVNPYYADPNPPATIPGMELVWSDEFNTDGKPNPAYWKYETGFVRNEELQWYQADNANVKDSLLVITGRRDTILNPNYVAGSSDWRKSRKYAYYSSSCIKTPNLVGYQFGRIEVRARIDTTMGAWPAIWTLGETGEWPSCGEVDIMEFYRVNGIQTVLANVAWGTATRWEAHWNSIRTPLSHFLNKDPDWPKKFHIWRMDWNKDSINLYLDNELLNTTLLKNTINGITPPVNPFLQKHYFLLNLALGGNGGDPSRSIFPITFEVDYIRVYQKIITQSDEVIHPELNVNIQGVNVKIPQTKFPVNINIFNSIGQLVYSSKLYSANQTIPLGRLPKGVTFVNLFNKSFNLTKKIIL